MKRYKKHITHTLLFIIMVTMMAAPVSHRGLQQAEAVEFTIRVGTTDPIELGETAETIANTVTNLAQTYFATWDNFKENVLDPLFWTLANQMISNMLRSLTEWVNSGFDGSPAFVTDVEGFLIDAVDEAVGEFINGTELGFLCSPFALDVRIALNIQYQQSKSFGAQCSLSQIRGNIEGFLSGTFSEGGWQGWFELTQGPTNDPNKALLQAKAHMNRIALVTRDREFEILSANEFFLNVQACRTVDGPSGPREVCEDSTLGNVVQDLFVKTTGAPIDRITFADEFNELVGTLISQFVNQVITGANGLLGLGASGYSSNSYGTSGNLSYLNALAEESTELLETDSTDPIGQALDLQLEYIDLLTDVVDAVDDLDGQISSGQDQYPGCFNARNSVTLTRARDDAETDINLAQTTVDLLILFEQQLEAAETPEEQIDIMIEFSSINADIFANTTRGISEIQFNLRYIYPTEINNIQNAINAELARCEEREQARDQSNPRGGGSER